jgi:hypothetical protein
VTAFLTHSLTHSLTHPPIGRLLQSHSLTLLQLLGCQFVPDGEGGTMVLASTTFPAYSVVIMSWNLTSLDTAPPEDHFARHATTVNGKAT